MGPCHPGKAGEPQRWGTEGSTLGWGSQLPGTSHTAASLCTRPVCPSGPARTRAHPAWGHLPPLPLLSFPRMTRIHPATARGAPASASLRCLSRVPPPSASARPLCQAVHGRQRSREEDFLSSDHWTPAVPKTRPSSGPRPPSTKTPRSVLLALNIHSSTRVSPTQHTRAHQAWGRGQKGLRGSRLRPHEPSARHHCPDFWFGRTRGPRAAAALGDPRGLVVRST